MAKQNMYNLPYRKHLQVYKDFSGGLNTSTNGENLALNEFQELKNVEIGDRGSLVRRKDIPVLYAPSGPLGYGQGVFYYQEEDQFIIAIGGRLYDSGFTEIPITGLPTGFQTERKIEAVNYAGKLYIATGTKLVEYDGTTAKVVTPHKPVSLEALYIGLNALSDNPDGFIDSQVGTPLRLDGVTMTDRYGVVNVETNINAFSTYPPGEEDNTEYRFEYRKRGDDTWKLQDDWIHRNFTPITFTELGDYEIRVQLRLSTDTTNVKEFIIPKYTVKETDEANDTEDFTKIHNCNRVVLHWDRLIMYDDSSSDSLIYISHLRKPNYFPVTNTLKFEDQTNDKLTSLVRYRDMLVAFKENSIQALFGKSPQDYTRSVLNTSVGCKAPRSAQVVGNDIMFLSETGVYRLKSVGYTESKVNVERIDELIEGEVASYESATGAFFNNEYHLFTGYSRFRYYTDKKVWTKDTSSLSPSHFGNLNGSLIIQEEQTGTVYESKISDTDHGNYLSKIVTREYDFGQPYHTKKLKELQLVVSSGTNINNLTVNVYADDNLVSGGRVEVDGQVYKQQLSGKCRRVRVEIEYSDASEFELLSIGFIYKIKSPK